MSSWLVLAGLVMGAVPGTGEDDAFEKEIRPLLVEKCLKCHGTEKQAGGLRLDSRGAILAGGDSGPAAVEGEPGESLIVDAIEHEGELRMPPKGKLEAAEVEAIRRWIERGLEWPGEGQGAPAEATKGPAEASDWWSFRPLTDPEPPGVKDQDARTEIDRFLGAKLEERGVKPSGKADRRTLIRRATYDLTGLPPTAEEVEAFDRDDAPDAFGRLVDRLLASSAYGERWGRHWLDLVRYADTAGENSDHPTPHSWRYRNWVIDAFNRDLPYDEFVRMQIAGDLIDGGGREGGVVATGYLAIARRFGHEIDKDMHLTHEDVIDTTGKTFLGLSIACARCHDHKYDPITARDYYAISGILQSTKFSYPGCEPTQRPRDLVRMMSDDDWERLTRPHRDAIAAVDAERAEVAKRVSEESAAVLPAGEVEVMASGEIPDGGEQALPVLDGLEVAEGEMIRLVISPMGNHGADSTRVELEIEEVAGPGRWSASGDVVDDLLAGNPHADRMGHDRVWCFLDGRAGRALLPEPIRDLEGRPGLMAWKDGDTPSVFVNASATETTVWTKLPPRSLFVHPGPDGPVALAWVSPIRGRVKITGKVADAHPTGPNGIGWSLERWPSDRRDALARLATLGARQAELSRQKAELEARAPRPELAYAVAEGAETDSPIHLRGDPEKPGPVVPRRWLGVLGGQEVQPGQGSGREPLAGWLSDASNPLASRVMVNRIWQQHFGRGLVGTPSDFGTRGMTPTHPELLDWLASRFVEDGWSIKSIHRRIMMTDAYQRSTEAVGDALERDADDELLGWFRRRRLEAEEIRDSLMAAAGVLDRSTGGPHPFPPEETWSFSQHVPFSTFYETDRRSVYLVTLRNRRHPFLGLFDGADPNATTPERQSTTVPTQALFFMNDPFFHRQAGLLADHARASGDDDGERLEALYRIALQRAPREKDRETAAGFLARYEASLGDQPEAERSAEAWRALARAVLASNEFLYLD